MCHSPPIFLCFTPCVLTSKEMLNFSWTQLDSASLSCSIHVLFFREQLHQGKSTFKSFIMLFSCCPHSVPHLPLMSLLSPVTYSASVSAEEITQMEEGTCQLTCSSFITVFLWPLYALGESAVTCPSMHHSGIGGLQQSGQVCCFWHAVRHPACYL